MFLVVYAMECELSVSLTEQTFNLSSADIGPYLYRRVDHDRSF